MAVPTPRSGRRVVRRARPTIDRAWSTVLADFPPELHPAIRQYAEAMQAEFAARSALTTAKIPYHIEWYRIDQAVASLLVAA